MAPARVATQDKCLLMEPFRSQAVAPGQRSLKSLVFNEPFPKHPILPFPGELLCQRGGERLGGSSPYPQPFSPPRQWGKHRCPVLYLDGALL